MGERVCIRGATREDADAVGKVHWSAFPECERELIAKLAVDLLSGKTASGTISLLAELDGDAVGHVAFSPVAIEGRSDVEGYILAPLAVRPDHQRRCIGARLVQSGIERLSDLGVGIVLVYGDPGYYRRFGFRADVAEGFFPPYTLRYPFGWQGLVLGAFGLGGTPARIRCVASLCNPALW